MRRNFQQILTFFDLSDLRRVGETFETVAVVDAITGAPMIIAALAAGAARVIPVSESREALHLAGMLGRAEVILAGHENNQRLDGFDISGYPSECRSLRLNRKILICLLPDLARALNQLEGGRVILIGFVNIAASVAYLKALPIVPILCTGKLGRFCYEDALCAGLLVDRLVGGQPSDAGQNDASVTARHMYLRHRQDICQTLSVSPKGKALIESGRESDLEEICRVDSSDILPVTSAEGPYFVIAKNDLP